MCVCGGGGGGGRGGGGMGYMFHRLVIVIHLYSPKNFKETG